MLRISKQRPFAATDWRIYFSRSSYTVAGRRLVARAFMAFLPLCARFGLVYLTIGLCVVSHAHASDTLTFDIAKARADLALIAFAEQADRTLLFSFDETHDKTANRVSGQYEVVEALELLLAGTGLSISMGTQGQLSVVADADSNGDTVVNKPKSILARIGMALTSAVVGSGAFAQESNETGTQNASAQTPTLEEVVVTAQRREQSIMEVPIAVTLVSGQALETFNLETSHDLQFLVPGVTFAASSSTSQITLRGVGTGYSGPGLSNSVSVYTDESYVSQQVGSNQLFYDMASVQVLKGPQGTLYGRNTTGGAMLYATNNPDLDGYSGYVQAGVAELDTTEFEGAVNIPLGSTVAVRLAGKYNDRGEGHVTNVLNGSEIGGEKETGFRAKVLWQPSDRLSLVAKYEQLELESNDEGSMRSQLGVGLQCFYCEDGSLDGAGLGFYETNQTPIAQSEQAVLANMGYQGIAGGTLRHQMEIDIQALNVDFDVTDNLTLSSYTQVRDMERNGGQDQDGSPYDALHAWAGRFSENEKGGIQFESFTQELKLASKFDGSFNFVLGASYVDDDNEFTLGYMGELFGYFLLGRTEHDMESTSFYFDGSYELTDALTLTGGVRNTKDEQDLTTFAFGATGNDSSSFSDTTYRVVLDYDVSDSLMVYGSFNTGFKSGGFNGSWFGPTPEVQPEEIDSFELGAKYAGDSISFEAAFFDYDWTNLQVAVLSNDAGGLTQENADAEMTGFEFSSTFRASDNLTMGIAGTWLDGEYTTYSASTHVPASSITPGARGFVGGVREDLSGYRLANAPEFSLNGNITYSFPIGANFDADLSALVYYSDEYDMTPGASGIARIDKQDSMTIVNLNLSVRHSAGWQADLYVRNATDEEYYTEKTTQPQGAFGAPALPRVVGARVRYNF
ncbi:MAG: TonB-dependent receptor domain-containing protein [Luminiphilus sp.]